MRFAEKNIRRYDMGDFGEAERRILGFMSEGTELKSVCERSQKPSTSYILLVSGQYFGFQVKMWFPTPSTAKHHCFFYGKNLASRLS